ncbi:LysR family transcriptional regulator [Aeromonas jandaei]|uniref:LysR family transcriptional regulator n=1 Tax=Aeromonas jandaei TaxID=650 RepID=A0A2S5FE68_AERJA|nr:MULTISPECIES: LysR family transcriptional regulator [Aeromonas]BBQ54306.1 LysR family transcriptional regulator [Aeromonas veronii]KIQ82654.1 LysR family transcriptional regulator [Aeromonas sp. L_1B5_3]MBL0596337.1 LysR family transcriptional regulator [Aeromonas jandaei]MBL0665219.1 LysR family transcriptional regulator [Aeromonas jandaei]MBW3806263.1 LysR family transcriptional regulator [Aeromonas jandaei]
MDRLTALRVFVSVVEQGSLSGAGEKLDMSRAMVSRYLAELESWMGARLLHRTTRRLSLTGPGEEALNRARAMLALGEEMEQIAVKGDDAPKGQLRITSSYSLSEALLVGAANDYLAQYPGTAIDILLLDRTVNLVEERIDLAVRITNDLDPNLVARRLGTCHSVVCASPAYLANHPAPQKVQDLALHNCLTYTYFGKSLWEFNGPDGPESVPVSGNLSANISNLLLEATLGGAGISLQPRYSAQPYLERGELVPLLTQWQPKRLGVYGVYATRKQMSPLLRSFLDFLLARMAADPLWRE